MINAIRKYYDFAVNGYGNVMYLHCNGWKQYSSQTDCRTYFDNGTLTHASRIFPPSSASEKQVGTLANSTPKSRMVK